MRTSPHLLDCQPLRPISACEFWRKPLMVNPLCKWCEFYDFFFTFLSRVSLTRCQPVTNNIKKLRKKFDFHSKRWYCIGIVRLERTKNFIRNGQTLNSLSEVEPQQKGSWKNKIALTLKNKNKNKNQWKTKFPTKSLRREVAPPNDYENPKLRASDGKWLPPMT